MKKLILAALGAAALAPAFGQETLGGVEFIESDSVAITDYHRVETNGFWHNWNFGVAAGPEIYFGDHNKQVPFKDRLSPALDVYVAKWFSPSIGIRLEYSGLYVRGATQNDYHTNGEPINGKPWDGYWLKKQKFSYYNLHLDAILNLTNIIGGYKPNRFWNTNLYFGVGWARVWHSPQASEVTLNVGWLNTFRLNKHFDAIVDVRGMMVNDRFSGDTGGRFEEGILSVSVGLSYWLKPGWSQSKTYYKTQTKTVYDQAKIAELNERINQMTQEKAILEAAVAEGTATRGDIRETLKRMVSANFINFVINKTTLTDESKINLKMFAQLIKMSDPTDHFEIVGYADKATGTPEINERLSRGRAETVYNFLIKEGVDPSKLSIDYKGGVGNMFYNDPRFSRCTITRLIEDGVPYEPEYLFDPEE